MPELLISVSPSRRTRCKTGRTGCELQSGAAGVEADGAVDALNVGRAEELSGQVDRSGDVGEGYILGMALDGDAAAHAVRGDGRAAAVDVGGGRAGNGGELNVAMVGGGNHRGLDGRNMDVAVVCRDIDRGRRGHLEYQLGAGAIDRRHGDRPRRVLVFVVRVEVV